MKKMFLTSGIIICMVCPVFATGTGIPADGNGLAQSADCVEDVLGVSQGTAGLKAKWEPNEINIVWKDNDGNDNTNVAGGSVKCEYDGSVTLPTNPTRLGYVFDGWKVVESG